MLAGEIPSVDVGGTVVDSLIEVEMVKGSGEARRLIAGGAVSVDGEKILEDQVIRTPSLLKKGKNSFILVR